jgi:hypothetical protein
VSVTTTATHNKALHPRRTTYTRQHKMTRHLNRVTSCNNTHNHRLRVTARVRLDLTEHNRHISAVFLQTPYVGHRSASSGSMLLSFLCPAIRLLHGLVCGMRSFSQAVLDERRNGSCTVYHVWLSSLDMAKGVRPDIGFRNPGSWWAVG